jgi:hypothetical protein
MWIPVRGGGGGGGGFFAWGMHLPCKEVLSNTKEKNNLWVCMTLQQWSKVVYAEGNPCLKAPRGWTHIHNSHPRGWTPIHKSHPRGWTRIHNSHPRGWTHIHNSHPRGWTHINKSHPRIFIHVWSWNYDYLDKRLIQPFWALFWQMCTMK